MNLRFKTIKFKLFSNYSMIIFVAIFILLGTSILAFSNNTTQLTEKSQSNLCRSLVNALDSEIEKMNTISMNVVYSSLIKSNFKQYTSTYSATDTEAILKWDSMNLIMDVITAIVGPFQTVSHVNLYSLDGLSAGTGILAPNNEVVLDEQDWYQQTLILNGSKYLGTPKNLDASMTLTSHDQDNTFIGLYRLYHDQVYQPEGFVEVLQETKVFFSFFDLTTDENVNTQVYIYNNNNEQIYPIDEAEQSGSAYYKAIKEQNMHPLTNYKLLATSDKKREVLTYDNASYQGLTVIVIDSLAELNAPLYDYIKVFLVVVFFILLMVLVVTYWSANNMTLPLHQLAESFHQFDLNKLLSENDSAPELMFGQVDEIDNLNHSFLSMRTLLKESSTQLIIARSEGTRAKMLALQSLMNPHFIYNILTHISIMAEEEMTHEIAQVSEDVSALLRYISTEESSGVPLSTELEYTTKYLKCMQLRFGDKLTYDIHAPDEMKSQLIPKLTIQPLVENSILHGFVNVPPWHIRIDCSYDTTTWQIRITDNGIGFEPNYLTSLENEIEKLKNQTCLDNLSIGGLGIPSVYLRLMLFYGPKIYMTVKNLPLSGSETILLVPNTLEEIKEV